MGWLDIGQAVGLGKAERKQASCPPGYVPVGGGCISSPDEKASPGSSKPVLKQELLAQQRKFLSKPAEEKIAPVSFTWTERQRRRSLLTPMVVPSGYMSFPSVYGPGKTAAWVTGGVLVLGLIYLVTRK